MFSDLDISVSIHYCLANYGVYALFATYPLRTAVLNSDAYTEFRDFELEFEYSGKDLRPNSDFAKYLDSLAYNDKDYFTIEEIRFLLDMSDLSASFDERQVDVDVKEILAYRKQPDND